MVKQDLNSDISRPDSPSSSMKKKRKTAPVSNAGNSKSSFKTTKKQSAAPFPKTISTMITGYSSTNKDLIRKIMVYDIPSI